MWVTRWVEPSGFNISSPTLRSPLSFVPFGVTIVVESVSPFPPPALPPNSSSLRKSRRASSCFGKGMWSFGM